VNEENEREIGTVHLIRIDRRAKNLLKPVQASKTNTRKFRISVVCTVLVSISFAVLVIIVHVEKSAEKNTSKHEPFRRQDFPFHETSRKSVFQTAPAKNTDRPCRDRGAYDYAKVNLRVHKVRVW